MSSANQIIDSLGGTSVVARALKLRASTVHSWRVANSIPEWRQAALLAFAMEKGVGLSTADFPQKARPASPPTTTDEAVRKVA